MFGKGVGWRVIGMERCQEGVELESVTPRSQVPLDYALFLGGVTAYTMLSMPTVETLSSQMRHSIHIKISYPES